MNITCANGKNLSLDKTNVMAILNATCDSFSDGGKYNSVAKAIDYVSLACKKGVDIIDVGGESSRPNAEEISLDEELSRTMPIIEAIASRFDICISIDTTKSKVADQALDLGAHIINDISAMQQDKAMAKIALKHKSCCILMHRIGTAKTMQNNCNYIDIIKEIKYYFNIIINDLTSQGIKREQLILDVGIGFSKNAEQNLLLLNKLDEFLSFNIPLLIGSSRKSFIAHVLENEVNERLAGSIASNVIAILKGASIIRVHDIQEMVDAAKITDAIIKAR